MPEPSPASPEVQPRVAISGMVVAGLVVLLVGVAVFFLMPADPYALRSSDWKRFTTRFVEPSGRVVDTGNGNVSHSEGQGYGMLLAVAFGDRRTFEKMWGWTKDNLKRPEDVFYSWLWSPEGGGKIADPNTASDGDLLIAWALLRAHEKWKSPDYQRSAAIILTEFQAKAIVTTPLGQQMVPGQVGFVRDGGVMLNPSYAIFPAYEELKTSFPSAAWQALADGGKDLIFKARFGKWNLCPNWVLVKPDAIDLAPGKPTEFGYDAIRVPLHIAWADPQSHLLEPFAAFWGGLDLAAVDPATVNLKTNEFGPYPALPGMQAVRQLTQAAVKKQKISVSDIAEIDDQEPYYSASLKLLVTLAINESFQPEKR